MIVLDNYKFNIKDDIFKLRSKEYNINKIKITKKPLLELKSIYILDGTDNFPELGKKNLIVSLLMCNKTIIFVYEGIYNIENKVIKKFLDGSISRQKRIKMIPYTLNYKSILIKNNKPILLAKKIKIVFNKNDNFEIKIYLDNFLIQKIIKKIINKKGISMYLGLTVETYAEDNTNEELLCVLGLNSLKLI